MQNSTASKQRKIDVLANRNGDVDILPWQEDVIRSYVPKGAHIHEMFRIKDGDIDCGIEIVYCLGGSDLFQFVGYLN